MTDDAPTRTDRLIQPPVLATDDTRSASRLELFFDLAYVLAIAQLASRLGSDMSWSAAAAFAGLFTVVWWSWVTPTVYANRFANNDLLYRLTKLAIMGAVVVMAGSAATATTTDTNLFAGGYLATQALLVGLYVRAWRHVQVARPTMTIYIACTVAGIGAWAASLPIGGSGKYALWAVGIAVEALAPVLASRYGSNVPVHVEHLPERFGLLVMLVLGESIAAVATGLHEAHWQIPSLLPAGCGFVLAAAAWWLYFRPRRGNCRRPPPGPAEPAKHGHRGPLHLRPSATHSRAGDAGRRHRATGAAPRRGPVADGTVGRNRRSCHLPPRPDVRARRHSPFMASRVALAGRSTPLCPGDRGCVAAITGDGCGVANQRSLSRRHRRAVQTVTIRATHRPHAMNQIGRNTDGPTDAR